MTADGGVVAPLRRSATAVQPAAHVALLGVGQVGRALLARLDEFTVAPRVRLIALADSRHLLADASGLSPATALAALHRRSSSAVDDIASVLPTDAPCRVIVDATASERIALQHAHWLSRGIHVVTANKLGAGAALSRWQAIRGACAHAGARYGDSATVGAGLPLLRTIRALRAGGDAILEIAGVLSGTLAWLFERYDGTRPFSDCVREAQALGYTEPDPRTDLSGEDVKRKLLILARSAGIELESDAVQATSLLTIDESTLRARHRQASDTGRRLHHVARLSADGCARIDLEALPPDDALACGGGCDNRVAIRSSRYDARPLLIRGPGAGPEVTAAALLDDILQIARRRVR